MRDLLIRRHTNPSIGGSITRTTPALNATPGEVRAWSNGASDGVKLAIAKLVDMLSPGELSDATYTALLREGVPVEGRG